MNKVEIATILKERIGASILSEDSHSPSKGEINAIRKFTRRDLDEASVYTFPCLAIDTTPTRNGVIYSAESQKATVKSWVGIPFLFNSSAQSSGFFSMGADHTLQAASQHARIYKSQLVETGSGNIGTLVWVYTFPDISPAVREFVNKIDTGILREVSIHVLAKNGVECSICGEAFDAPDHEHQPGVKYGKETCYIKTVGQLEPVELSSVACPGSLVAHVMDESEVSKYKLVSLREALCGSHSPIEANMDKAKPLAEASDAPADGGKKDDDECDESKDDDECDKESKNKKDTEDDPDDKNEDEEEQTDGEESKSGKGANKTGKPVGKQSFTLFNNSEECPVCSRTPTSEITEEQKTQILSEYREEIEAKILVIVEAANKKVKEAEDRASALVDSSKDVLPMLEYFVKQTVDLAISKGLKRSECRESYSEEIRALGFPGIKALYEVYSSAPSKKDEALKELEELARHHSQVFYASENENTPERPVSGFTAPIGPASRQGK